MNKRPVTKPLGLSEADRSIVAELATMLGRPIAATGSRVKGYWTDESDYDLQALGTAHDLPRFRLLADAIAKKYDVKIDLGVYPGTLSATHEIVEPS